MQKERSIVMYGLIVPNVDSDCDNKLTAERLLRSLGANGRLTGFAYTVFIVNHLLEEPDNYFFLTKIIYPETAKYFHVKPASVEHAIRTVIRTCWDRTDHSAIDYIAGRHLERMPTNSEFIDILSAFLKYHNKESA